MSDDPITAPAPVSPTPETFERPCPYCDCLVPIARDIRMNLPDDFARPATDCPTCGYSRLPRRLWTSEWK